MWGNPVMLSVVKVFCSRSFPVTPRNGSRAAGRWLVFCVFSLACISVGKGDDLEEAVQLWRGKLSQFEAKGSFQSSWIDPPLNMPGVDMNAYTPGPKSVSGKFHWIRQGQKFLLDITVIGHTGINKNALLVDYYPRNILVCDGTSILCYKESPNISTGCSGELFDIGNAYQVCCGFLPYLLRPEKGAACFLPEDFSTIDATVSQNSEGYLATVKNPDARYVNTYLFEADEMLFLRHQKDFATGTHRNILTVSYVDDERLESVPHVVELQVFQNSSEPTRTDRIEYEHFQFGEPSDRNVTFSSDDIAWCNNARILSYSATSAGTTVHATDEGFNAAGKNLEDTVAARKLVESNPKEVASRKYVYWLIGGVIFALATLWIGRATVRK